MNKIKDFFKKSGKEGKIAIATTGTVATTSVAAFASGGGASGAKSIIGGLLGYVFGIFFYIGVVLLAWGIGQLVLAFKNEDGDSKSRAIMLIVASIVLMGISGIFNGLNLGVQGNLQTNF